MKRKSCLPLVLFLWALALPLENAAAQTVVRIGYSGGGTAKNLHKTIEKAGLWKKRGLDVRLIYFTSGATMAQAMVGGDIDIADSDVPAMLNAVTAGVLDGKLITVYVNRFPFAFVARSEIKSPEELRGKRLAISRLPAMISGQIDGTLVGTYDVPQILESGCCRVLVDMLESPLEYARFGQVVPTQLLKTRREVLLKFVEGLVEGIYIFKTNRELALSVLKQEGIKSPQYGYERVAASLRQRPVPEPKGVQAVLDSVKTPKSKITLAKDAMDTSLMDEIDKSGYIAKLYGK